MIAFILAVLNGICGVALIFALAVHPEVYRFPVACRLSVWVGAVGLIVQSLDFMQPSRSGSLLAQILTDGGYWILLLAALLEARKMESQRHGFKGDSVHT